MRKLSTLSREEERTGCESCKAGNPGMMEAKDCIGETGDRF